ncbi:MAG: hypothetical protein QHC67_10005 [Sphingobium sp.]|uniref:hypothetical protein n=1 Tax=Sphingobium sp. TaxID=1912891 RepID=UPI0029B4CB0C|nr:hypothetical protein [Sphingobium sp.]MDX3910138.1 hypothetical protein [Sphingobium sp.]
MNANAPAFQRAAQANVGRADSEIVALLRAGDAELTAAERDVAERHAHAREIARPGITMDPGKVVASYQARFVEIPLLERTAALIALRRANFRVIATRQLQVRSIEADRARHRGKVAAFNDQVRQRNVWQDRAGNQRRNPLCQRAPQLPGCGLVRDIRRRDAQLQQDRRTLQVEAAALKARSSAVTELALRREQVEDGAEIFERASKAYQAELNQQSERASGYVWNQATAALRRHGRTAFLILLGVVLLPVLHKLLAFFVIAPLAARTRPVRLLDDGPPMAAGSSGISIEVQIDRDSELLLRSGLQSSATDIRGSDAYVLDWRMPFSCLAAGLINLQRLRSDQREHLVVTGIDANHRVAAITVPTGGAVVVQPRALLGVVKQRSQRLVITRPWRIFWLISWITAQFRYIIFHGPCTLIVQGCNGVIIEEATRNRKIDRRLTLGFDAGVSYGAARSTSFQPYLRGQASLFNDRFDGTGRYFYEQRAAGAGKSGLWGRGLKGLGDALLGALGI